MKKVVKVDDMIKVARNEMMRSRKYLNDGEIELARIYQSRSEAMMTMIAILAIKDYDNWDDKWNDIYDRIFK